MQTRPLYLVAELTVRDPGPVLAYAESVRPLMARFGGHIVATSPPPPRIIEGEWQPDALVVQRWRNADAFDAFWRSPEYVRLRALRQAASESRILVLPGLLPHTTTNAARRWVEHP
jgi:uncharacterized protein (DUF1330 family)